ncbi:hypothetical protein [uncultured Mucilaginibacter sp.]|uniref:hypothetical protein n=1 Tax=uncultured Mucilaginibacter sp. TaxID=797541 RepID=UPI0025F4CA82|nr:hypothetical protein [uncultured Mucilaginibacter sp.]
MKNLIYLAALCLIMFSCKHNKCDCPIGVIGESGAAYLDINRDTSEVSCKIYQNVNAYLKDNLKDYLSYQPISFAEFYPVKSDTANNIANYLTDHHYFDDSVKVKTPKLDSLWKLYSTFKPIGYTIKHKYRAKNGFGAYGLSVEEFRMDTLFNILYVKQSSYLNDDFNSIKSRYEELKANGEIK